MAKARSRLSSAPAMRRRHRAEWRFRAYGILSITAALAALAWLLASLAMDGVGAFRTSWVLLDVPFDEAAIDPSGSRERAVIGAANYQATVRASLGSIFPDVRSRAERRELAALISTGAAFAVRSEALANPSVIGTTQQMWLAASAEAGRIIRGKLPKTAVGRGSRVSPRQIEWIDTLRAQGRVDTRFNWGFFTRGDSREPELAGVAAALVGSALSLLVALVVALPIGALSAIYLEEISRRNLFTAWIEINISNLAAVPSIIFGLLGLAFFLNVLGLPRSAPLVGGLVLALMTLPTIIITSRASLQAVPDSIRSAALALGATRLQTVFHHVVPLALPGIMTGTILGMARALGETAPLLMIGMVAFVVEVPRSFLDPATALPVQVFLWADSPERGFEEKTAAAILVLLVFLVIMNSAAIVIRNRFERQL